MLLADEFLLLCLDDQSGRARVSNPRVDTTLAGALLSELALLGRVRVTPDSAGRATRRRVQVVSTEPVGEPELDATLAALAADPDRPVKNFLAAMGSRRLTKGLRKRRLQALAAAGALDERTGTILGLFPSTTWPARDPAPERDVRERLHGVLVVGLTPDPRTAALAALLHASRSRDRVFPTEDKRATRERAKALFEADPVAWAVRRSIDDEEAATVAAAT